MAKEVKKGSLKPAAAKAGRTQETDQKQAETKARRSKPAKLKSITGSFWPTWRASRYLDSLETAEASRRFIFIF